MFEYSTQAYGSQFSGETNGLKILYLVVEILSKNGVLFFLGHPVMSVTISFRGTVGSMEGPKLVSDPMGVGSCVLRGPVW